MMNMASVMDVRTVAEARALLTQLEEKEVSLVNIAHDSHCLVGNN